VITHPERNPFVSRPLSALAGWLDAGCFLQITADSLLGRFGSEAERCGWELLRKGWAHFVASDAHGTRDRTTRLDTAFAAVARKLGDAVAVQVFEENPRAVILKQPLSPPPPPAPERKRWFSFGK
jgi:protein-tyrosine phosphatase